MLKSVLLVATVLCCGAAFGQRADRRLIQLINGRDYFGLEREYSQLSGRTRQHETEFMAKTLLGCYFNRPEEVVPAATVLLEKYSEKIGDNSAAAVLWNAAYTLFCEGEYSQAAQLLRKYAYKYPAADNVDYLRSLSRAANALADVPMPVLERPAHDLRVPFRSDSLGTGTVMKIPVEIGGSVGEWLLDSGVVWNFATENFAREHGIRIVDAPVPLYKLSRSDIAFRMGVADSVSVGGMVYRNALFVIIDTDGFAGCGAVLGLRFLNAAGEFVVDNVNGEIIFPAERTQLPPAGRNLVMLDGIPFVSVSVAVENSPEMNVLMRLNSGCPVSFFLERCYGLFGRYMDTNALISGKYRLDGMVFPYDDCALLPLVQLRVGGEIFCTDDALLCNTSRDGVYVHEYGTLGCEFLAGFDTVTVNLRDCFVSCAGGADCEVTSAEN